MTPLAREFYARGTVEVARALLGQRLVHIVDGVPRSGRIVETEAYLGPADLACHTSKGRTARTEVMFGPPGFSYVFLIYGMHHCFNIVTGNGEAVLVRALEPDDVTAAKTMNGPGKLTRVLGITRADNGLDLLRKPLFIEAGDVPKRINKGPRIGVDYAKHWARRQLRFWDAASAHVSQ